MIVNDVEDLRLIRELGFDATVNAEGTPSIELKQLTEDGEEGVIVLSIREANELRMWLNMAIT